MVLHKSTRNSKLKKRNNRVYSPAQKAILTTIAYSDIFSFAPTKNELWHFLISAQKVKKQEFLHAFTSLEALISEEKGYVTFRGKEANCTKRFSRNNEVEKKTILAQKAAKALSVIPTILCIGISGGLAANNVTADDDIDFFIITQKNRIFVTRFWVTIVLSVLGLRRKRGATHVANKICTNLFIDQTALQWQESRDLYTAREIAQIKPLYEKANTYETFFTQNNWIKNFFPNVQLQRPKMIGKSSNYKILWHFVTSSPFEIPLRFLQKCIMKPHQTREIVTNHYLGLHPFDYRMKTLRQLKLKMRELGLLTKD